MAVATSAQHAQHGQAQTPAANADAGPSDQNQQWDGDRMFNVYIWDYCVKRGYNNTARELIEEAKLEQNPIRPIDAKQGLLYEWWTVFWYLFHAKSNNISQSTEDAVLYIQTRLAGNAGHPRFPPNGIRNMPGMGAPGVAGPNGGSPGQLPPNPTVPHGMPNGIGPSHPSQNPSQGHPSQHQQQPPHQPPPLGFPGHVQHQPNGVTPQSAPRGSITGPPIPGQPPRAPGPAPGFYQQSPTMAHPHTPTGGPPPYPGPNPNAMGGQVPPNGYPQPMRGGMPPPGSQPNGVANASSPGFAQGSSGSRAPTPAQQGQPGSMTQPSPSMAHRVPQTPPNFGASQGMSAPGGIARGVPFEVNLQELQRIDPTTMNELRSELGLGMKEMPAMSPDEKNRLLQAFRHRQSLGPGSGPQHRQGRGAKRSSTSPGEEHAEIPPKDGSSPPAQKKVRPSPDQSMPSSSGLPGGNAVGQMFPQNGPPGAMRGGPSFAPQVGNIPPGAMMHGHMPPGAQPPKGNLPFPGNVPMNKMPGPESQHYGSDVGQSRSAAPPFQPANQLRPQGKPGPNSMPPPSSPASAGKAQPKMEGVANSPLTAPPSSSGSVGARNPSPATPVLNSNQMNASAPSPSAANLSRPATASSNPPHTAPPGSGPTGVTAPPAPASAPPGPTDESLAFSTVDFLHSDFNFRQMFGRDDPMNDPMTDPIQMTDPMTFESDFQSWFGADMSLPELK